MKILLAQDLKDSYYQSIYEVWPGCRIVKALDFVSQKREIGNSQVLAVFSGNFKVDLLYEAKKLKWIQSWSAGVDQFTEPESLKYLIDNNIKLTTMSGVHGNIIAEHVMGLVISLSRKLYKFYWQQKNQQWQWIKVDQLEDRVMAIIGLGSIGQEIAARARAFKMKIIGVKRDTGTRIPNIDHLYSHDELLTVLKEADYVVVAVPLTDETHQMIGEDEFRVMKNSACFINISRGQVVDEEMLIRALEEGHIAGAGLDVFTEEPLPPDSPLYKLDNVLITPHIAGVFPAYDQKAIKIFLENLKRFKSGSPLLNLVDYNRGY
ncbi:MAG: D-2-hydroxyacid dehydrogenase [Halanaerobiales bacterium]|nr:D-2-hydroxyacid dehydrogenase [Halanaerobiales bacterium]